MEEGCFKNCDLRSAAHTNERICNANCVLPPWAPQIGDRDKITVRSFITRSHFFLFDSPFFFFFSFDSLLILRLCTFFLSHVLAYTGISIYLWLFLQCASLEELFLIFPLQIQTSAIHKRYIYNKEILKCLIIIIFIIYKVVCCVYSILLRHGLTVISIYFCFFLNCALIEKLAEDIFHFTTT